MVDFPIKTTTTNPRNNAHYDIHHFLMSKLPEEDQEQIRQAQRQAAQQLIAQAKSELDRADAHMVAPPIELAERFATKIVA